MYAGVAVREITIGVSDLPVQLPSAGSQNERGADGIATEARVDGAYDQPVASFGNIVAKQLDGPVGVALIEECGYMFRERSGPLWNYTATFERPIDG